ncbi:MAG: hypothetical protein IPO81_17180 [Kouleothrix sp.]|nr:hypothetical protein [Kouleothrix sp.]
MGRRDDDFIDERTDAALRRVLARLGEPSELEPPPDLVARTARRLPSAAPALAARSTARAAALRLALRVAVFGALALVALLGLWGALGGGARLAMLLGDGAVGPSRALLTLDLLAKPLLGVFVAAGGPLLLGGALTIAGAAGMWWWLLRRTPVEYVENAL